MILDRIVETKQQEVQQLKQTVTVQGLLQQTKDLAPPLAVEAALQKAQQAGEIAIIAEIKKASPSKGLIREDFDPEKIAKIYQANGASMISVLTDRQYFQGSLDYLRNVRRQVSIPLLRKDFMIDEIQVVEARANGADIVLLIVACLEDALLSHLSTVVKELGMTALVEVHTEQELERAMRIAPTLIGVNNRDLQTFKVDRATTGRIAKYIPETVRLVSESGIETFDHIQEVKTYGASAVLVGESLMRAQDIGKALRTLRGVTA